MPVLVGQRARDGPILERSQRRLVTFEAPKDEPVSATEMKHELPDTVSSWNRVLSGIRRANSSERLEQRRAMPRFALKGLGTPAPIAPPERLVVTGLYRHVRNPMYVAVTSLIVGQALFFGDVRLLEYGLVLWAGFHLFVLAYEEPTLRAEFGAEYRDFCAHVRRWIPRLKPWRGPS